MKKKLPLFFLLALSTTLNGCSCSAEEYHSYVGSRSASVSYNVYTPTSLSEYVSQLNDVTKIPYYSLNHDGKLYYDTRMAVTNAIEAVKNYAIVTNEGMALHFKSTNIVLMYSASCQTGEITMYLTSDGYLGVIKSDDDGKDISQTIYQLTQDDYYALKTTATNEYEAVQAKIASEMNSVAQNIVHEFFVGYGASDYYDTFIVDYDKEVWGVPEDYKDTITYRNHNKPSYYESLKDLEYTYSSVRFENPEEVIDAAFYCTFDGYIFLHLCYDEYNNRYEAVFTTVFISTYCVSTDFIICYYRIDQTKYEEFATEFKAAISLEGK